MKKELILLHKELLFTLPDVTPALRTYAVVDSIRDERVKEKILFSGLEHVDLWHEELFENEQEVPLYLIELEKENELLDYLLNKHQESIAAYFISPYDLKRLQAYYSTFTYANIEVEPDNFKKAIFGFYDPSILPDFIQTLYDEEKVDEFFAGAGIWLSPGVESEDELFLAFRSKEGNAQSVNLKLSHIIKEENPMLNFDDVSLPAEPSLEAYVHEVYIDQTQIKMLDETQKRRFAEKLFAEYQDEGYRFQGKDERFIMQFIALMDECNSVGIESESGIYQYILLTLLLSKNLSTTAMYDELKQLEHEDEKIAVIRQAIYQLKEERREAHGR